MTIATRKLWQDEVSPESLGQRGGLAPTVVEDLPVVGDIEDGEVFVIRNGESRYLTHLFHKYAGKFIPNIPRWALRRFLFNRRGAIVLDPFVGSGTTLVEAALHGQSGYGVDVDPLARLISNVKTSIIPESRLRSLRAEVAAALAPKRNGSFRPGIPTLSHWFNDQAVADLSAIHDVVEEFADQADVHDFLLVCFSSIIRRVSNADNQTMKTYVSHTNPIPKTPAAARPLFIETVHDYSDRLSKFQQLVPPGAKTKVLPAAEGRTLAALWEGEGLPPADLAITSPPYIKSVDYIYNQMVELFWIGDRWHLETQEKQNNFKRRYIGNDRVSANERKDLRAVGLEIADRYIREVFERDEALAFVMWRYFTEMDMHFRAMRSILRPGAHYVVVIGDSTLASVAVPTHSVLALLAARNGFRVGRQFAYEIRNKYMHFPRGGRGGVVLHDWIIDLICDN
ncbi:MAG: hypothetical protein AABO41_03790 [Acidobacteriota bacterium]